MWIRGLLALLCCLMASPAWAFPDNGVLDTFTGTDNTSPPNSNWTNAAIEGGTIVGMDLEDNAATTHTSSTTGGAYWNASTFGAGCEAYATIVDTASTTGYGVACRLVNIGANTTDGYEVAAADGSSEVFIGRLDNSVFTTLGSTISQAITTTDKLGIRVVGNQICAWFSDSGGPWTQLGCRTDATYSAGGNIGMEITGTGGVGAIDDFGGGNVAAASGRRPIPPILFQ